MKIIGSVIKTLFLSLAIIANTHFAYAQTASILPPGKTTFFDSNGNPLTGGKVKFYVPGTTTLKTTWQDAGQTTPNTNPVILDSAGRAIIYGNGTYQQEVRDKNNNLIWNVQTSSTGSGGGGSSATVGDGQPVGSVQIWAGMIAPQAYAFAYGQEFTRAGFPELFAALTFQSSANCTIGSSTISGLSSTEQLPIGAKIESTCLNAGSTIVSKTASTIVASSNAIITASSTARFFPYGNGDGVLTFNAPDLRGRSLVGRDNMGNIVAANLTSAYFGVSPDALNAIGGNQSTTLLSGNLPPYTPSGSVTSTWTQTSGTALFNAQNASNGADFSALNLAIGAIANRVTVTGTVASSFTGTAQGGTSTPFSNVMPSVTTNYVIKTIPDTNPNSYFGVASIGGMYGVLTCGTGIICAGNNISAAAAGGSPDPTTIIYRSPLANSIDVTLQTMLNQTVPAAVFGVLCDGVTDDTAALIVAVASTTAAKATLQLPPGNCLYSSLGTLPANAHIRGAGPEQTTMYNTSTTLSGFIITNSGVVIEDARFLPTVTRTSTSRLFDMAGTNIRTAFRNLSIIGQGVAFHTDDAQAGNIMDVDRVVIMAPVANSVDFDIGSCFICTVSNTNSFHDPSARGFAHVVARNVYGQMQFLNTNLDQAVFGLYANPSTGQVNTLIKSVLAYFDSNSAASFACLPTGDGKNIGISFYASWLSSPANAVSCSAGGSTLSRSLSFDSVDFISGPTAIVISDAKLVKVINSRFIISGSVNIALNNVIGCNVTGNELFGNVGTSLTGTTDYCDVHDNINSEITTPVVNSASGTHNRTSNP